MGGSGISRNICKSFALCSTVPLPSVLLPSVLWCCWLGGRRASGLYKNCVMRCWHCHLSAARCRFAFGPADATLHSLSLAPVNPDWFYLPGFTFLIPAHPGNPGAINGYSSSSSSSLLNRHHTSTSSPNFLQAGCPSWWQTNSVRALKADNIIQSQSLFHKHICYGALQVQLFYSYYPGQPAPTGTNS